MPQEPGVKPEQFAPSDDLNELKKGKVVGKKIEEFINGQPDDIRNPLSEIITDLVGEVKPLIFPTIETGNEPVHPAEYNSRVESDDGKYRIGIHAEATSPDWESVIIEKKLDKDDKLEGSGMSMASRDIFQVKLYSDGRLEIYIDSRHMPEVRNIQDFTTHPLFNENLYFLNPDLDLNKLSPEAKALIVRLINETTNNIKNSENFEKLKEKKGGPESQIGTEEVHYSPFENPLSPLPIGKKLIPELRFPPYFRPEPFSFREYKNQEEFEKGNEKMLKRQTQNFIEEDLIRHRFQQEYEEEIYGRPSITHPDIYRRFIEGKKDRLTELERRALTEEVTVEEANRLRAAYRAKRNLINRLSIDSYSKLKVNTFGLDINQVNSWGLEEIEAWIKQKESEMQGTELETFQNLITNHSGDPIPIVWKDYKDYQQIITVKNIQRIYTLPDGSHEIKTKNYFTPYYT